MKRLLGVAALLAGALALTKGVVVLADEPATQPTAANGQVEPGGGTAMGDDAITNSVKRQLLADGDLRRLDLSVTTSNGVVTLAGIVPSNDTRREAVDLARHTPGVAKVNDQLRVIGSGPSDPEVPAR